MNFQKFYFNTKEKQIQFVSLIPASFRKVYNKILQDTTEYFKIPEIPEILKDTEHSERYAKLRSEVTGETRSATPTIRS